MNNYTYTYAYRNIFDTIRTSEDTSLEKYTSHFIGRVVCEKELETEQRLQHIDLPTQLFWLSQPFFPVLLRCSTGGLGAQLSTVSWFLQLDLEHWLQALNSNSSELSVTGVISLFYVYSIQNEDSQGHPLISWYLRPNALVIYTGAFLLLTAWPGRRSVCKSMYATILHRAMVK